MASLRTRLEIRLFGWRSIEPGILFWVIAVALAVALSSCEERSAEESFQEALEHRANGEIAASVIELKNALQIDPENSEARLLLGTIYLEMGDLASAEKELYRARSLKIPTDRIFTPLVNLWLAQGDYQKILNKLPDMEASGDLDDTLVLSARAKAYQGLGRLEEAREAYAAVLQLEPDNREALYGLAWTLREIGDPGSARATIKYALEHRPNDPDFIALEADLAATQGNWDQAAVAYQRLLALQPNNIKARVSLATVLFANGSYREASEHLDAVLSRVPSHGTANYLQAAILIESEDYEAAKRHSERVLLTEPDHIASLLIAASSNYALGFLELAANYSARVLQLRPDHEFARVLQAANDARSTRFSDNPTRLLIDDFAHPKSVASQMGAQTERWMLQRIGRDCLNEARNHKEEYESRNHTNDKVADVRVAIESDTPGVALLRAQQLERDAGNDNDLKRQVAEIYLELLAFPALQNVVEELLDSGGVDPELLCLAASAYLASDRGDKARLASRSLTELLPNNVTGYLLLAKAYRILQQKNRYSETLFQGASLNPNYGPLVVEDVRWALKQGDTIRASELIASLGNKADYQAIKVELEGGLSLVSGDYVRAASKHREAFEIAPSGTRALKWAYALSKADNNEKSREVLVKWLRQANDDVQVWLALANKDLFAKRYLEAAEAYSTVVRLNPNNVLALNNLAWASLYLGEDALAVAHAERAFELARDDPRVLDTFGYMLLKAGHALRATKILEKASILAPENSEIRVHLAEAMIAQGNDAEARALLQQVISQDSDFHKREQAVELLEGLSP